MGFLTAITIRHDCLHDYENNHALLGKDIIEGMEVAARTGRTHRGNSIIVHNSHHADGPVLYLAYGGGTRQLTYYEIKQMAIQDPNLVHEYISVAKNQLKHLEKYAKELIPIKRKVKKKV